ncbi:MAG: hypothetical protein EPO21_20130 [Chloroflexota bacterium]|nr:MAG: hypothetical protein EPO21_20130 [Chloroflexota bacterium]
MKRWILAALSHPFPIGHLVIAATGPDRFPKPTRSGQSEGISVKGYDLSYFWAPVISFLARWQEYTILRYGMVMGAVVKDS